jgi:hypothetical protein
MATVMNATIEELLETVFSIGSDLKLHIERESVKAMTGAYVERLAPPSSRRSPHFKTCMSRRE